MADVKISDLPVINIISITSSTAPISFNLSFLK
jgi:hypothetical protein